MRNWLRRWKHPWRLFFGVVTLGTFMWLLLGVFGVVYLSLTTSLVVLFIGLFAYEATI